MEEKTSAAEAAAGAVEQRCPICLEDVNDKTFIDACFHCFCFRCIVQWSQVTTTCPMCKISFNTLIHNVEANDKYTQVKVEPRARSSGLDVSLGEARRFRYRTTRVPGEARTSTSHLSAQQQSGREREATPMEERERRDRERERRERRRAMSQQLSNPASDERRRVVYSLGLWAQPPRTDGRKERVREISASFFQHNPACTHRLVPWLTREFRVLLGPTHVQFMIQLVLSLISKIDLEGEEFPEHLQPFLPNRTSHFLHELISFARSPLNVAAYDHSVRYEWPADRLRDTWDPEATVNVVTEQLQHSPIPGSSGLATSDQFQERLFQELTATRWDDSPPFLHPSSPILIHGSDSELDGEESAVSGAPSTAGSSALDDTSIALPPAGTTSALSRAATTSITSNDDTTSSAGACGASSTGVCVPPSTVSTPDEGGPQGGVGEVKECTRGGNEGGNGGRRERKSEDGDGSSETEEGGEGERGGEEKGQRGGEGEGGGRGGEGEGGGRGGEGEGGDDGEGGGRGGEGEGGGRGGGARGDEGEGVGRREDNRGSEGGRSDDMGKTKTGPPNSRQTTCHSTTQDSLQDNDKHKWPPNCPQTADETNVDSTHVTISTATSAPVIEQPPSPLDERPTSLITSTAQSTACGSSTLQCSTRDRVEGGNEQEACIVINADSDGEELQTASGSGSKLHKLGKRPAGRTSTRNKGQSVSRKVKDGRSDEYREKHESLSTSGSGRTAREQLKERKREWKVRERERHKKHKTSHEHRTRRHSRSGEHSQYIHSRRSRSRHRADSGSKYYSSSDSYSDAEYEESARGKSRRRSRRSNSREFESVGEPYYTRERCHHRSRLYSDDYVGCNAASEHETRPSTSRTSRRKSHFDTERKAKHRRDLESSRLHKKLTSLDQEIVEHKREVLRAMLRCERLKLLHRQLQGEDLPDDCNDELGDVKRPLVITKTTPTGEVVQQLANLDRAIVDGKRKVLRVMKKMEEQAVNSDSSSD